MGQPFRSRFALAVLAVLVMLVVASPGQAAIRFDPPRGISAAGSPEDAFRFEDPTASPTSGGGAVVTWRRTVYPPQGPAIQAAFISPSGEFGAPIDVADSGGAPSVVGTGPYDAVVVWADGGAIKSAAVSADGRAGPEQVLGAGLFPTAWNSGGRPMIAWERDNQRVTAGVLSDSGQLLWAENVRGSRAARFGTVQLTERGRPQVVWLQNTGADGTGISRAVARAAIGRNHVGRAEVVLRLDPDQRAYFRALTVGGNGLVVTREYQDATPEALVHVRLGRHPQVRTIARDRSGAEYPNRPESASLASTARGGAIVAWWDQRGGDRDRTRIRAVEVSRRGRVGPAETVALGKDDAKLRAPRVAITASGQRVLAWRTRGVDTATLSRGTASSVHPIVGTKGHYVRGLDLLPLGPDGVLAVWADFESGAGHTILGSVGRPFR